MIKLIMTLLLSVSPTLPSINGLTVSFDDGPTKYTVKILDILKKHKVKAIFCIPAARLSSEKALATAKRAMREGHIICNHSVSHPDFSKLTKGQQHWQIRRSQQIFKKKLGIKPVYFRPPFGVITRTMRYYIAYYGMNLFYWSTFPSLDSRDYSPRTKPYQIYNLIIRNWIKLRKKGRSGIALFHDTNFRTASIIEKIVIRVKKGYKAKKSPYK